MVTYHGWCIEDGRSIPSFEMVMRFLKAYMVDIGEFLTETGYVPPNVEPVGESKRIPIIHGPRLAVGNKYMIPLSMVIMGNM